MDKEIDMSTSKKNDVFIKIRVRYQKAPITDKRINRWDSKAQQDNVFFQFYQVIPTKKKKMVQDGWKFWKEKEIEVDGEEVVTLLCINAKDVVEVKGMNGGWCSS